MNKVQFFVEGNVFGKKQKMGFLERMLGNLMGGRLGGCHGDSKHGEYGCRTRLRLTLGRMLS
jgi:hypothetical protein